MSKLLSNAVRNSTWTGIGSLGTAILGFVFAGKIIGWLGASEAGFVIAVTTIAGINAGLSELGLGTAATRIIARAHAENDYETVRKVSGVCCLVSGGFGVFGFLILSIGAPTIIHWAKYEGNHAIAVIYCVLAGLVFLLSQISSLYTALLTAAQRFDWTTKLTLGLSLAQGICGITFLKLYPSVLTVGITYVTLAIVGAVLRAMAVHSVFRVFPLPLWDRRIFHELWEFGRWIYLAQITGKMADGLDKVILVSLFGSATLAFYSFAQRIYVLVHTTLVGQANYLFPMLSAQGADLHAVADRTEERVRWFIAVIAGAVFSGLIITGPVLLSIVVSPTFAAKASFQLLVFSFVGYIHAQSIVPYFYNLSKGDAKGNSFYQIITGFGILPALMACAYFGEKYAALGQLMIICGVLFIAHRGYSGNTALGFGRWFLKPLWSSLALMLVATAIHFALAKFKCGAATSIVAAFAFYLSIALGLARIERHVLNGESRVETLGRGLSIIFRKMGLSTDTLFRIFAIPQSAPTVNTSSNASL